MKSRVFAVVFALVGLQLVAQYPVQQFMLKSVPQAKYYNAGLFPEYGGHFGFPLLSNIAVTGSNSGFSFNGLFNATGDLDLEAMVDGLSEKNYLNAAFSMELLTFGFKVKNNYFSLNLSHKVDVDLGYNRNLFEFIVKGNAHTVGKTVSFDGTGFDFSTYSELGLGYVREIDDVLSVGGRVKLLMGIGNLSGNFDGVSIYTDPDDFSITANSTFSINSYGGHLINEESTSNAPIINTSNFGLGLDFGASYQLTKEAQLYASVVDLGYISWNDYGERAYNDGASFTYDGLPLDEMMGDDDDQNNNGGQNDEEGGYMEELGDSISETFKLKRETTSYSTSLKTKIFVGGNYQFNKWFDADVLFYGRVFKGAFYPAVMLGGGVHLGKIFTLKATYAAINKTYDNLGAGVVLNLGGFQVYANMDNLYGLTQIDYTNHLAGSFGINFLFGGDQDNDSKKKKKRKEESKPLIKEDKKEGSSAESQKPTELTPSVGEQVKPVKKEPQAVAENSKPNIPVLLDAVDKEFLDSTLVKDSIPEQSAQDSIPQVDSMITVSLVDSVKKETVSDSILQQVEAADQEVDSSSTKGNIDGGPEKPAMLLEKDSVLINKKALNEMPSLKETLKVDSVDVKTVLPAVSPADTSKMEVEEAVKPIENVSDSTLVKPDVLKKE